MTRADRADHLARRVGLAVGQRLLLGLAPSLLAVVLVLALAYYGELGRQAPEYVVTGAGLLAVASLLLTWWNTRYLVGRIRRLSGHAVDQSAAPVGDDLDRIEDEVVRLKQMLGAAVEVRDADRVAGAARLREHATMLAASVRGMTAQLDEVRLPLHILLDARFGELNENQEELLAAARTGAEEIDTALRRLSIVADADRGALVFRKEPVAVNDVLRAILPMVRATAERTGARVDLSLEPALPRAWANRSSLAEALALLATRGVEAIGAGETMLMSTTSSSTQCELTLQPWKVAQVDDPSVLVAHRTLEAQSVSVTESAGALTIRIPRATLPASPRPLEGA